MLQKANEHTMKSSYRTYNTHISETLSSLLKHFPEEHMPYSSDHFITHISMAHTYI